MKWAAIFLVINFNQSNFNCLITSASTLCVLAFKLEDRERGREGEGERERGREGEGEGEREGGERERGREGGRGGGKIIKLKIKIKQINYFVL